MPLASDYARKGGPLSKRRSAAEKLRLEACAARAQVLQPRPPDAPPSPPWDRGPGESADGPAAAAAVAADSLEPGPAPPHWGRRPAVQAAAGRPRAGSPPPAAAREPSPPPPRRPALAEEEDLMLALAVAQSAAQVEAEQRARSAAAGSMPPPPRQRRRSRPEDVARRWWALSRRYRRAPASVRAAAEYEFFSQLDDVPVPLGPEQRSLLPVCSVQADGDGSCSVCLCEYEAGDQRVTLPCHHDFHPDCIGRWFDKKRTCPLCKAEVRVDTRAARV